MRRQILTFAVAVVAAVSLYSQARKAREAPTGPAPAVVQLTNSSDEQDYPAIAQDRDAVYVSYVEFTHGDRSLERLSGRTVMDTEPKNFDWLARPAGGDRVFLLTYSKSKRSWRAPVAVSEPRQDVMRTAVAVDGAKRVWVFWSARREGNYDIYAKSYAGGRWSSEVRLTTDPGTDLNPVAAIDAKGRVWVAWQGFRKENLEILAAAQDGERFTKESIVSFSPESDWDPAIATAPNGEVAVSWDTYDKGDYDVYFRRLKMDGGKIAMETPVPVAASPNFEARSSIAYDPQNRLWVAYEASATKWGKDFGAYETTGVSLYQDHNVRVKCFQGKQAFTTAGDLLKAVPEGRGGRDAVMKLPDPQNAATRQPDAGARMAGLPLNSFPRIAADPNGNIYLAFRHRVPVGRGGVGGIWEEQFTYFDGAAWKPAVSVPHTVDLLDKRAALAAIAPGDLMMIVTTDYRQPQADAAGKGNAKAKAKAGGDELTTTVQTDLYAAEFRANANAGAARLIPVKPEEVAAPDAEVRAERAQIAKMRNYRVKLGSDNLQIMRGEFHRHTEFSGDGGGDGPLVDAYRYMVDAASMDWGGCCDHDNGGGREYYWWTQQKYTDAYHLGARYVPMFSYERSVQYPEGHRNTVTARRGVRPLPRLKKTDDDSPSKPAPDTQMLYRYLRQFDAIVASHTSGTNMGTDWRDNDPLLEPVVEIYQGDRQNYEIPNGPRSNRDGDSIGGWRPLGFVSLALQKGYRLSFQASSDHISTHMSYCNLWVRAPTREAIMEAFHKRRVYGATDDILADVRCGAHFMGEEFTTSEPPSISVKLWGTAKFAKVHIVKDGEYVYSTSPTSNAVDFVWKDTAAAKGKTSYYYVRGEQSDGELVWVSPMWIKYQ